MNLLGTIAVHPALPERLARLRELAHNLWWSWCPDAVDLFAEVGSALWDEVNHNPVQMLSMVSQERLDALGRDAAFMKRYESVLKALDEYMSAKDTWFERAHPDLVGQSFAYFSAEFGLHECLPIYSGGLGILSGDHCKSASDLGIPLVGVGLLYNQGYFKQRINGEGWQEAEYSRLNFSLLPISEAKDSEGRNVEISVDLPDHVTHAKVWKVQVGRVPVYLLDTDIEQNSSEDRRLSSVLYGGDREMRICQEIILGMGGVAALRALGLSPGVYHMNEGHSAFLSLARIRDLMKSAGLPFSAALEETSAGAVFTTHTPVPAGHDAFSHDMMDRYFNRYNHAVGISRNRLLSLGQGRNDTSPSFSMTVLALNASRFANGVSKLHGEVSRELWREMWWGFSDQEMPITHITNGVHTGTWMSAELTRAMDAKSGSGWRDNPTDEGGWRSALAKVSEKNLWKIHCDLKRKMIEHVRERVRKRRIRLGRSNTSLRGVDNLLDPEALTIGFARRFATYKRATIFFQDLERTLRILSDKGMPVQIIFAGKAHPADEPGKEFIRRIHEISQDSRFRNRVVMVEGYDINLARHLVQGVDVWLNNPRRPLEASGTSGQKAAMNGVINFSVLDGWWDEGYNGENGWTIGERRAYDDHDEQDRADTLALYETLENEIVPLYYERESDGTPVNWVRKMKESMISVGAEFNTHRMLKDYTDQLYVPAFEYARRLAADKHAGARDLAEWKDRVRTLWHQVAVQASTPGVPEVSVGDEVSFSALAHLGNLTTEDVAIELFVAPIEEGRLGKARVFPMERIGGRGEKTNGVLKFEARFKPEVNGNYTFGVRAVPSHPSLGDSRELGLVRWADPVGN
ncbi:MAG: glycosyltransferase family 1 protein [Armatimonadetes bacterium]|nr:glycosyltransferase family 1 protein [Armatimonadota bacterium]